MTKTDYVIDVDFFRKISSDKPNVKSIGVNVLLMDKLRTNQISDEDFEECLCFIDILKAANSGKFKMRANFEILQEYQNFIDKCPNEIYYAYTYIFRDRIAKMRIISDDIVKDSLSDTPLKSKKNYITVAVALPPNSKTIVSTHNEIKNSYKACLNKLCEYEVECIHACEAKEEILFPKPAQINLQPCEINY